MPSLQLLTFGMKSDTHCFLYIFLCLEYRLCLGKNMAVEVTPCDVTSATAVFMPLLHHTSCVCHPSFQNFCMTMQDLAKSRPNNDVDLEYDNCPGPDVTV